MNKLVYSPQARADLRGIYGYIAQDNPAAADRFVEQLRVKAEVLLTFPLAGEARPDLHPEIRVFAHRGYAMFYRVLGERVRVERVIAPGIDLTPGLFRSMP